MKISLKIFMLWCTLISSSLVPCALAGPPPQKPAPAADNKKGGGAAGAAGGAAAGAAGGAAAGAKGAKGNEKDDAKKGGGGDSCDAYKFSNNKKFSFCCDLNLLKSYLHWNLDTKTNTVELAFRQVGADSSKWISWGINPRSNKMLGTQALVAYADAKGVVKAYTSPLSSYSTKLEQGNLNFSATKVSGELNKKEMIIYATLKLPKDKVTITQVWQQGPMSGKDPGAHPVTGDNVKTVGKLNLETGETGKADDKLKKIHGILNAVSWGFLLPIGAMMARHVRAFIEPDNRMWFYLHIGVQITAYILGVTGWGIGLKIGKSLYKLHRYLGITIFVLATLQVFALLLRPKPDHEYRKYWNWYHLGVGYLTIILSIFNCYKGLTIFGSKPFKTGYMVVIILVLLTAILMEVYLWYMAKKKKEEEEQNPAINYDHPPGGTNYNANNSYGGGAPPPAAANGYGNYQGGGAPPPAAASGYGDYQGGGAPPAAAASGYGNYQGGGAPQPAAASGYGNYQGGAPPPPPKAAGGHGNQQGGGKDQPESKGWTINANINIGGGAGKAAAAPAPAPAAAASGKHNYQGGGYDEHPPAAAASGKYNYQEGGYDDHQYHHQGGGYDDQYHQEGGYDQYHHGGSSKGHQPPPPPPGYNQQW